MNPETVPSKCCIR